MFSNKPSKLAGLNTISADQLKEKLNQNGDFTLINVLSKETYVDCHIPGSISIPFEQIIETLASWEKDKEIILYCAQTGCNKSEQAYQLLAEIGFTHILQYQGGMKEWLKKGFDATGTCTMRYLHE